METKKLDFGQTMKDSLVIGIKNTPSIFCVTLLWALTIWIPYINVGTTIALYNLPVQLASGKILNPLSIFESRWRKCMGSMFLVWSFVGMGVFVAMLFMFFPAIVLGLMWMFGSYYVFTRQMSPIEALEASRKATEGSKWLIFFVQLIYSLAFYIISTVIVFSSLGVNFRYLVHVGIDDMAGMGWVIAVYVILAIIFSSILEGIKTSVWQQLKDNA